MFETSYRRKVIEITPRHRLDHREPEYSDNRPSFWLTITIIFLYLYSSLIPFQFDRDGLRWESIRQRVCFVPYFDGPANALGLHFSLSNAVVNGGAGFLLGWFAFFAVPRRWPSLLAWLIAFAVTILTGFF